MKAFLTLFLLIFFMQACNNHINKREISKTKNDSSSATFHGNSGEKRGDEQLDSMYKEYIDGYKKPYIFDSVFFVGSDTFDYT